MNLRERGKLVVVFGYVGVKDGTVMLCHIQGGMTEKVLKGKGITAAIHKIFSRKGMAKHMKAGFFNATLSVVFGDRTSQTVFCQLSPELIWK